MFKNIQRHEPLYKRDSAGKIRIWYMEIGYNSDNDAAHRVVSGLTDGKLVESDWKTTSAKNIGKSNATNAKEQAEAEIHALYTKQLDRGYFRNVSDIDKFSKTKPMLASKYEDHKFDFENNSYYTQMKLDGCVSGDLQVETENGLKTVKEVFEGKNDEFILAYNHELEKLEFSKILGKFKNERHIENNSNKWLLIKTKSGNTIKITDNHRVYLPELDVYREAKYLNVGDILLSFNKN